MSDEEVAHKEPALPSACVIWTWPALHSVRAGGPAPMDAALHLRLASWPHWIPVMESMESCASVAAVEVEVWRLRPTGLAAVTRLVPLWHLSVRVGSQTDAATGAGACVGVGVDLDLAACSFCRCHRSESVESLSAAGGGGLVDPDLDACSSKCARNSELRVQCPSRVWKTSSSSLAALEGCARC